MGRWYWVRKYYSLCSLESLSERRCPRSHTQALHSSSPKPPSWLLAQNDRPAVSGPAQVRQAVPKQPHGLTATRDSYSQSAADCYGLPNHYRLFDLIVNPTRWFAEPTSLPPVEGTLVKSIAHAIVTPTQRYVKLCNVNVKHLLVLFSQDNRENWTMVSSRQDVLGFEQEEDEKGVPADRQDGNAGRYLPVWQRSRSRRAAG